MFRGQEALCCSQSALTCNVASGSRAPTQADLINAEVEPLLLTAMWGKYPRIRLSRHEAWTQLKPPSALESNKVELIKAEGCDVWILIFKFHLMCMVWALANKTPFFSGQSLWRGFCARKRHDSKFLSDCKTSLCGASRDI